MNCDIGEATHISKLSVTLPMSQLILQPFRRFTYITAHTPTLPLLHLHHSSFSNPSFGSPTPKALLILQPFCHFTYVTTHSPTLPLLYLRHSSFSNPSAAPPTSQFILQLCFRFSYVTSSSLNSPVEPPMYATRDMTPQFPLPLRKALCLHSVWMIKYTRQVVSQDKQCLANDSALTILLNAQTLMGWRTQSKFPTRITAIKPFIA